MLGEDSAAQVIAWKVYDDTKKEFEKQARPKTKKR
jgi:hypothetical protein